MLYGEEEWLKTSELNKIIEQTVPVEDMMNHLVFDDKDTTVQKITDACETMPFFASYKLVIVKESGLFKTGKKDETQQLLKWLEGIPDYAILVFLEKEVDKRNALYKYIQTKYEAVACTCPDQHVLKEIVRDTAKQKKMQFPEVMIGYFVDQMPQSIHYILSELDKLASYVLGETVTKQAIDEVCVFSLEQRVFELLKHMTHQRTKEALAIYTRMIESKESPIGVLVLIGRQYRMLLQVKYLLKTQAPVPQIAKTVGVPLFVAKEMVQTCTYLTFKQLEGILEACLEADIAIKTGKMDAVKCVELLIIACIYSEKA